MGKNMHRDVAHLAVSGSDLLAAGVPQGPQIGWVLRQLANDVAADPALNSRDRLLERVPAHQGTFVDCRPAPPRFRVTAHAVQRYQERVRPQLTDTECREEMHARMADAPFSRTAPPWSGLERAKVRGGYLLLDADTVLCVDDGKVRTVLTRSLARQLNVDPCGPPPGPDHDVPWPRRRYLVDQDGVMQCRTLVDGRLLVGEGRSTMNAYAALKRQFAACGLEDMFDAGQRIYRTMRRPLPARRAA